VKQGKVSKEEDKKSDKKEKKTKDTVAKVIED